MRILAVDLAGVCRRFYELDKTGSLSDGSALSASIQYINRAADGFDRVAICRDVRPSFRRAICPTYKADREDPGPVYEKLEIDVCARMYQDGWTVFPSNNEAKAIRIGEGYPEADDVIASLAAWYTTNRTDGWVLCVASEDSDLLALVCDDYDVRIRRFDGSIWGEKEVFDKLGCDPNMVPHAKALAGDSADRYKPFPHPDAKPDDAKTKPGIGWKKAVELLKSWGTYGDPALGIAPAERVLLAAQDGAAGADNAMPDCHERRCLIAGGADALKMGYGCATMLNGIALNFDRILPEPVKRSLTQPAAKREDAAAEPPKPAPMVLRAERQIAREDGNRIQRYALQPRGFDGLQARSKLLFDARMFPQFDSWQGVAGAIWLAAEMGIPAGQALRHTYVVKGKHAYSAAMMVALVKREPTCKLFRLDQSRSNDQQAVVRFWHQDDPEPQEYVFTIKMAERMGVTKGRRDGADKTKWETQPHLMLAWAAMRECARLHWPEVVAGMYTPDELRGGHIEDAEFETTREAFDEDGKAA